MSTLTSPKKVAVRSLKKVNGVIPKIPDINVVHAREKSFLAPMGSETTPWLENAAAVMEILDLVYIKNLQEVGAKIASAVVCAANVARVTDGETAYYHERKVGRDVRTERPLVYKSTKAGVVEQGRLTEPGRMGGLGGWTLDKDAIAAALASYTHNFVALLMAFFSRAKLPLNRSVILPNLVLAETREPRQFVPPLSMGYSGLPKPVMTNTIKVSAPIKSSFWVELWSANKEVLGKTETIEVEPGTSEIVVSHFLMPWERNGFLNVEPYDAPQGLVIEKISIFPPL